MAIDVSTYAHDTPSGRADRYFFGLMAVYCGVTTLGGFVPSFFLRSVMQPFAASLPWLVMLHGAAFTLWIALFVGQTALVAAGRKSLHRRMGTGALVLVPTIVAIGLPMIAAFEWRHGPEPSFTLLVHSLANVAPLLLFAGFAAAGYALRTNAAAHKRLMLFATLALQPAGFSRLIGHLGLSPALNVPAFGVLCAVCLLYDLAVERRIRAVTWLGVGLLFGEVYGTDVLFTLI
jgi:hypothetical protein